MGRLRDLNRQRRKQGLRWELYKTARGNIPKELLSLFVDILAKIRPELLPAVPPEALLNKSETETLRRTLNFVTRFGLEHMLSDEQAAEVKDMTDFKPPVFEKVGGKYKAILEVKISSNTPNNPRLLGTKCPPSRLVFLHGFAKRTEKLADKEKEKADKRRKDLIQRGEC